MQYNLAGTFSTFTDIYNNSGTFHGTSTLTFLNYANSSAVTFISGEIATTVQETPPNSFTSASDGGAVTPGTKVTRTVSNVVKQHIANNIEVRQGDLTHTCSADMTVTVTSRVTEWEIGPLMWLINPTIVSRNTTIEGTVTIDGVTFDVSRTITFTTIE